MGSKGSLDSSIIVVGRIGAPHGIKGWVHMRSFTVPPDNILNYHHWHLSLLDQWRPVVVLSIRSHGKHYVVLLKGYEDRDKVALLRNVDIGVHRSELPTLDSGEYYWTDLIGLVAITENGESLGTVSNLLETGSNDVLIVKGEKKEHLIPYIPGDYVLEVNLESRVIRVSWDPEF